MTLTDKLVGYTIRWAFASRADMWLDGFSYVLRACSPRRMGEVIRHYQFKIGTVFYGDENFKSGRNECVPIR